MSFIFGSGKYQIRGKVALVTGALGDIGRAISLRLASLGASLVLVDILPEDAGERFCDTARQGVDGLSVIYIKADLRNAVDIQRMLDEGMQAYQRIDILVNNAGLALYEKFYNQASGEAVRAVADVNMWAPIETCRLFVSSLKELGREGVVVNMCSIASILPAKGFEIYGATKAALVYFTKVNAYLAPQIRVTGVAPSFVDSNMFRETKKRSKLSLLNQNTVVPLDVVADAVVRQIESRSSGGQTVMQIGRWKALPMWHLDISLWYALLALYFCWAWSLVTSLFSPTRWMGKTATD
ncbi:hypothetical protein GGF46_002535 [Coemansia sp. RSA 552]|nr:hypothetical protein GGF46_002535 [Coemansia sp. RSA 552]